MTVHELAGKPAPRCLLVNIPRLMTAYYVHKPDVSDPNQRVAFGTSGHRGSSLKDSFNEEHILVVTQGTCQWRIRRVGWLELLKTEIFEKHLLPMQPH